ncbi:hypothetical protein [Streptacidiphilus carbonis]|jgi:heme A synthase|uniref:hypothetical protein n=1 Tax=Streptacidiphilus carbonis TaxID=105422 RepID=UPI000693B218|nr:hypothetical protein [Streptacidiphilus carbonis]
MEQGRSGVRVAALRALRGATVLAGLLAVAQPVLAGGFLQGHYPLLQAHEIAAMILATAVLLALAAAVAAWRPGGAPVAIVREQAIALVVIALQMMLGFSRELIIHVPLGVGVVVIVLRNARSAWTLPLRPPSDSAVEAQARTAHAGADA